MGNNVKLDKLPKSALALYVKLYCKKKGESKNIKKNPNLMEATKSWVNLSKSDKQYFNDVLKKQKAKIKKKFAANLQNAELYMKKKHINNIRSSESNMQVQKNTTCDVYSNLSKSEIKNKDDSAEIRSLIENNNTENLNTYIQENDDSALVDESNVCEPANEPPRFISEPVPPLRTSKELFENLKTNNESLANVSWIDLSKSQKLRFQRALSYIKNDYINQYTAYLQNLTAEQLFQHYKSIF